MLEEVVLKQEMENAINWIKEYVKNIGAKGVVVGNSGGKDSATVLAMATKAIGNENVLSVYMPCFSSDKDFEDAKKAAKTFDVRFIKVDLTDSYSKMEDEIQNKLSLELSKEATINMKPRLRMTTLYSIAQTLGYLVIGTGNLCEAMVRIYNKVGRQ